MSRLSAFRNVIDAWAQIGEAVNASHAFSRAASERSKRLAARGDGRRDLANPLAH